MSGEMKPSTTKDLGMALEEEQKDIPFDAEQMDPSTTVPNEIWVKILSLMTQKEIIKARTVCRAWRNVIDEHFQFSVIVHEDKVDLSRIAELKMKDLLISKLSAADEIIQYPELLKKVRFWGLVHPRTLQRILLKALSLEELSLTRFPLAQSNMLNFMGRNRLELEKLTKLEVLGYGCKDVGNEVVGNLVRLFSQDFPALVKVFINVSLLWKQMDAVLVAFLGFLNRHKTTLLHVNASLVPGVVAHESVANLPTRIPENILAELYDGQLQLESLRLGLSCKYIPTWLPIIRSQRKLVEVKIQWLPIMEQPFLPTNPGLTCDLLYQMLTQCAVTLTQIELKDVSLPLDTSRNPVPFNARVLTNAKNLRKLVLTRNKEDCHGNVVADIYSSPTIRHLAISFPRLEDLEIVRFRCSSSDLEFLVSETDELKNVKLQHTGVSNMQGVHWGLIETLTEKPKIKIINISPTNYNYQDGEHLQKMSALKLKYPGLQGQYGDHVYFDFDRFRQGAAQPYSKTYAERLRVVVAPQEQQPSSSHACREFATRAARRCRAARREFERESQLRQARRGRRRFNGEMELRSFADVMELEGGGGRPAAGRRRWCRRRTRSTDNSRND